ncbi:hypothetical protein QBC46DRAFT_420745 [Diplogelasinospora grovesii]|uniref:Uncharacterized protein n=1 Tax=Diplogelasinospora grovesii TaxID=303347 RepID=A0AAN6S7H7_9PEZI|nr:hypothetical protein QBC46DRAFT_420745 [Diplogelasinospora grovesii]
MIPEVLISRETLTHVGLSEAKATELWGEWSNWPTSGIRRETDADDGGLEMTFIDFIISRVTAVNDITDESDLQWRACLNACGIDVQLQDTIMDTHFKYLRLSESCLYWVKDTIKMRYAELEAHIRGSSRQPSVSGRQQNTPGTGSPESWASTSASAASRDIPPGHTVLFRATNQAHIAGLFDEPSDFSGFHGRFYFTPDYQVAEYHAYWAKKRIGQLGTVAIVRLCIPNTARESLSAPDIQKIFWPSPEWKELVWRSRTQRQLPSRLEKYEEAVLVVGTTSRKPHSFYRAIKSWDEVTEKCVLRAGTSVQGHPSVQYVFSGGKKGRDFLVKNGAQNIRVFPYSFIPKALSFMKRGRGFKL